jgi:PGF-CTERM protein
MKLRKSSMCLVGFAVLVLSCFTASASSITDGTNDIWHWAQTGTTWSWVGNVGNKPNIDITEVSYSVNDNKITISLQVSGDIQTSDKVVYWVYYNSTDTHYLLSYSNGNGMGTGLKGTNFTLENYTYEQNVTISGGKLSVVLNALGDTSKVELWGFAQEYTITSGDTMNEYWGDWAPNEKFTYDTGTPGDNETPGNDSSPSEKKTPGFEVVAVIAAVAIALILVRRRQ